MSLSLTSLAASLFALTNPIGNMVLFITMMQSYSKKEARSQAIKIMCYTWIGLTLIAMIGTYILKLFDISIAAFSLAGGLFLAHIGFVMTSGQTHKSAHNPDNAKDTNPNDDPTIVPLTIPLLVGPGAMVTIISFFNSSAISIMLFFKAWGVITGISLLIGICFYGSTYFSSLSPKVIFIANRIMGLIIGSIGLQLTLHAIGLYYHINI